MYVLSVRIGVPIDVLLKYPIRHLEGYQRVFTKSNTKMVDADELAKNGFMSLFK